MSDNYLSTKTPPIADNIKTQNTNTALPVSQCSPCFAQYIDAYEKPSGELLALLYPQASNIIRHFLDLTTPLLLVNSRHWDAAKLLLQELFNKQQYCNDLISYDQETLFGRLVVTENKQLIFEEGELNHAKNGMVTLDISPLLVSPALWFKLKSALQRGYTLVTDAVNADNIKQPLSSFSKKTISTKIALVASRSQLDELSQLDPEYTQVSSLFCELPSQITVTQSNVNVLIAYIQDLTKLLAIPQLDNISLSTLFIHLSKLTEHQQRIHFSPADIKQLLQYAVLFSQNRCVTETEIVMCLAEIEAAQSLPRQFSEEAIKEGQVYLQLSGEKIGQVNGLSVVELLGYPCEFGEVFRISASDMLGDGEIIDVERKVELAGNIHAKSTIIVQGYLNHLFGHVNAFPYSCHLVFEQSYQESDGDSAALAILLATTSCYAQVAVKQNVFVTGSLDQHGNVLAIGGINQKIHAITRLFELELIKDPISIIMPQANIINLVLEANTLQLIEQGNIQLHPLSHCHQAFPIIFNLSFKSTIEKINQRIDHAHKEELETMTTSIFTKIKQWL